MVISTALKQKNDVTYQPQSEWLASETLYFDIDASTAGHHGLLTNIKPTGANKLVIPVGRVLLSSPDAPAGRILITPDVTILLKNMADLDMTGAANDKVIGYYEGGWRLIDNGDSGGSSSGVWTGNLTLEGSASAIVYNGSTIPLANFNLLSSPNITNLTVGGSTGSITLGGATTAIKMPSLISGAGDLLVGNTDGSLNKLAKGAAGTVLKVNSGGTGLEWGVVSGGGTSTPGYKAGDPITSGIGYIKYNGNADVSRVIGEWDSYVATAPSDTTKQLNFNGKLYASQVWGAVFNDYAELFKKDEPLEPGDVVIKK